MWFRSIFRRKTEPGPVLEPPLAPPDLSLSPAAYRQLDRLRVRGSKYIRGGSLGRRASQRRRPDADFREHRKYVPGDDVRFVDWKASARSEQIYLKQGELPQETTIHILLDTSASMRWGAPPKRDGVLLLAAALGYLALSNDDRLQVVPAGTLSAPLRVKGKAQFPALINYLRDLGFTGQPDFVQGVRDFSRQNRGGIVLMISDLLDMENLPDALSALPRPGWDVTVVHALHPGELAPEVQGEFEMLDAESGAHINYDIDAQARAAYRAHLDTWCSAIELACIEHNTLYTQISTGWSLDGETLPYLRKMNVLEPL